MKLSSAKRGFTLIELLVVIAIIGILSSVVLASLSTAREKARDATRISDVKNIQLSLELYYDGSQSYPKNNAGGTLDVFVDLDAANLANAALVPTYIPKIPLDPSARHYRYIAAANNAATTVGCTTAPCPSYVLNVGLERGDNTVLANDADAIITGIFNGTSADATNNLCDATAGNPAGGATPTEKCYDLRP